MSYKRSYVQNLINGFMSTLVIYTACELKIFDTLKFNSKTIDELAYELNVDKIELLRIIRPLVQYKILDINEKYISVSELGETLLSDKEDSLASYALFSGRESLAIWSCMYPAIKNKKKPREFISNSGIFNDMQENIGEFEIFNRMMSSVSKQLDLKDFFTEFKEENERFIIADVGGGTGTIIKKFLDYYNNAIGIILDLSQAKNEALNNIKANSLEKRCKFVETDFFKPIETKADVYVLSRVLHDWKDEPANQILKNIKDNMESDSRIIVIEEIIKEPEETDAIRGYMNDIQVWVFCDGKERTYKEFEELFLNSGLKIESITYTPVGTATMILKIDEDEIGEI